MNGPSKREVGRAAALLRAAADDDRSPTASELSRATELVNWWRSEHAASLSVVAGALVSIGQLIGGVDSVSQRLKRFDTVINKLGRMPSMTLTQMEDIAGVRIVVHDQRAADQVAQLVAESSDWTVRRVRQYVDGRDPGAKADGYRAIHVVVVALGRYVEVQIRTRSQDRWAQSVESATRRLGEGLKFGGGPDDLRNYFVLMAETQAEADSGLRVSPEKTGELARLAEATREIRDGPNGT